jgi:uncharacterized protein YndB with AHSA1/START domain
MPDAFRISSMVPGLPERVYSAWLDSGAHAAFTGASAKIDPTIGGKFAVLDGAVQGRTVELLPGRRIVQTWRAKEFPNGSRDSRLEIQFEGAEGSTRVTIMHSLLPPGLGERQKQNWIARYFQPMRSYFGRLVGTPPTPPRAPTPTGPSRPAPLAKRAPKPPAPAARPRPSPPRAEKAFKKVGSKPKAAKAQAKAKPSHSGKDKGKKKR